MGGGGKGAVCIRDVSPFMCVYVCGNLTFAFMLYGLGATQLILL